MRIGTCLKINLNHIPILDTSIIAASIRLKSNIFEEIESLLLRRVEFIILSSVISELKELQKRSDKLSRNISLILEIIEKRKCTILSDDDYKIRLHDLTVDNLLIEVSLQINGGIATIDDSLKHKARRLGIPVIYMRSGKLDCEPSDPEFWGLNKRYT